MVCAATGSWIRYPVQTTPGKIVNLTAVVAPKPTCSGANHYPAIYWLFDAAAGAR